MNAPEKINATHGILEAASTPLCAADIARQAGTTTKAIESQLKALNKAGLLDPQPGRGGVMYYRLTTPVVTEPKARPAAAAVQAAVSRQPAKPADIAEQMREVRAEALVLQQAVTAICCAIGCNPDVTTTAQLVEAVRQGEEAKRDGAAILGLLADIRKAAGDAEGRLMQDELAQHIAAVVKERDELRERLHAQIEQWQKDTGRLTAELQALRTSSANAINEADRLRAELATERQAREALQEQSSDAVGVTDTAVGYLVRVPKRAPRLWRGPESARAAALSAVRAGAARAEVLAVVPVGTARRGAEWQSTEAGG